MAELIKSAGNSSITYTIDEAKSYTLLKVVASDGLILGASMESGVAYQLVLNIVLDQINAVVSNNTYTATEKTDGTSAINYLTQHAITDFNTVLNEINTKAAQTPSVTNVKSDLNDQLKAIHARLDRIDDDLISHYAGISQLVQALSVNPFTAGSAAISLKTYNFSSVGQKLLKTLLNLVPGYNTFKQLQHLDTAALVNTLESNLSSQIDGIANTLATQLQTAVIEQANAILNQANAISSQVSALSLVVSANAQLQNAISNGANSSVISTLTDNLANAHITYNTATGTISTITDQIGKVEQLSKTVSSITGFLDNMTNIAKGKTYSSVFRSK